MKPYVLVVLAIITYALVTSTRFSRELIENYMDMRPSDNADGKTETSFARHPLMELLEQLKLPLGCEEEESIDDCFNRTAPMSVAKYVAESRAKEKLIEVARKRASARSPYVKPPPQLPNATHPKLANMDQRFAPKEAWANVTFPDIEIAGLPKAGTSQLYKILSNRPDAQPFHSTNKENCFETAIPKGFEDKSKEEQLYVWHERVYQRLTDGGLDPSIKTVNGCIGSHDVVLRYQYMKPTNAKVIVLFRDPADWLW